MMDRAVLQFATVQLFSLVYLEKFAVGPRLFQVSLPTLILLGSFAWLVMQRQRVVSSANRLGWYCIFVSCCLFSQAFAGGSLPSILELIVLYSFMTMTTEMSEDGYRTVLDRFVRFMILPAFLIIFQYVYQIATGRGNPISLDSIVPKYLLLSGYVYEAHYPWYSPFMRPNGFFFLETSFASALAASAAIIEMTYFKRPHFIVLLLIATAMSMGGTGITMLASAAPFLLARKTLQFNLLFFAAAAIAVAGAYAGGLQIPLISRLGELDDEGSSGSGRLIIPATHFLELLFDPAHMLIGAGAGSIPASFGDPWPVLKLVEEYGMPSMISFVMLYATGILKNFNLPLKAALSIVFHVTGGYLLNPVMVEFVIMFCFIVAPAKGETTKLAKVSPSPMPVIS